MTVGAEMDSTTSKVTNSAANNRNIHRAWPADGSLQAGWTGAPPAHHMWCD